MNSSDALREIQGHAAVNSIRFTDHAEARMSARSVSRADVRCALVTADVAVAGDNGAWRVEGGRDLDGEGLAVVVVIDRGAVVVTVF